MENKDFLYRDYAAWKIENFDLLEQLKCKNSVLYDRIEPVYTVTEHVFDMACESCSLDEDYLTIFQVGFNYLNQQIEIIKLYFENLFNSNCDEFVSYSELVGYLLYVSDIRSDLENNEIDFNFDELNEAETCLENAIMERRTDFVYLREQLNEALNKLFKNADIEYVSIVDIYVEIAESLGIYLYEDDELVLGKEI